MSLADFAGPSSGTTTTTATEDWARDDVYEAMEDKEAAESGFVRKTFGRTAGAMGNFRDSSVSAANSRIVPLDMEKPYLGFVANLLTNLPEADLREFFGECDPKISADNIKMIYKERSTFAFVEFTTIQDLQNALLVEGKFLKNRPVKVDIATPDQREKMMSDKARGALGPRDPKSPNAGFPDRDLMGAEQRSFGGLGDRRNPRSGTSPNAPRDFGEFSRDGMGAAQPELSGEIGSGPSSKRTPNSAFSGGFPDFNFRDGEKVEQPSLERRMPRQGSRNDVAKDGPKEGGAGSWRGSKVASPNTKEGGSWRDAPKAEQPQGSWRDQPAEQPQQRPKREFAPKDDKKELKIGGEAQPEPKKDAAPPKAAAAPAASAWGENRFAGLRK